MPSLYRNIDQLKPSYARQDFSLVDRLTSERNAYIEGVRDGRKFIEVLKKTAQMKPVVVHKGGHTQASHMNGPRFMKYQKIQNTQKIT